MDSNERLEQVQAAREALMQVSGRGTSSRGDTVVASLTRYLAAEALHEHNVEQDRVQAEETAARPDKT